MRLMVRWHRWEAVIVGLESGHVSDLPFVRFRHERDAQAWVARMNASHTGRDQHGLTVFDYRRRT